MFVRDVSPIHCCSEKKKKTLGVNLSPQERFWRRRFSWLIFKEKKHPISYQTSLLKYAARLFITWHIVTMLINLKCANCWNAWIFDASPWSCWLWQKTKISIKRKKNVFIVTSEEQLFTGVASWGQTFEKSFENVIPAKNDLLLSVFFSLEIIFAASLWYFWASVNWPEWFSLSRG